MSLIVFLTSIKSKEAPDRNRGCEPVQEFFILGEKQPTEKCKSCYYLLDPKTKFMRGAWYEQTPNVFLHLPARPVTYELSLRVRFMYAIACSQPSWWLRFDCIIPKKTDS